MFGLGPSSVAPLLIAPFVGSFLGVLALRLPRSRGVVLSRSSCDSCGQALAPPDLLPVLSWLLRRGRCRYCGAAIGLFYPGIELAALAIAIWASTVTSGWILWASCGFGWSLLTLAIIDLRERILPDQLTLPLVPAGLAVAYLGHPEGVIDHGLGAVVGFTAFAAVAWLYHRFRGIDGLGLGDAKLLAASGAWLSWIALPGVVLVAALSGLIVVLVSALLGHKIVSTEKIAFGPYLCLSAWLSWLYGPLLLGPGSS